MPTSFHGPGPLNSIPYAHMEAYHLRQGGSNTLPNYVPGTYYPPQVVPTVYPDAHVLYTGQPPNIPQVFPNFAQPN